MTVHYTVLCVTTGNNMGKFAFRKDAERFMSWIIDAINIQHDNALNFSSERSIFHKIGLSVNHIPCSEEFEIVELIEK